MYKMVDLNLDSMYKMVDLNLDSMYKMVDLHSNTAKYSTSILNNVHPEFCN